MRKLLLVVALVVVLVMLCGGMWWWGFRHAAESMRVVRVSPTVVANAMQQDHFYSDYGTAALLMTGSVARVTNQGSRLLVTFDTQTSFKTFCRMNGVPSIKANSRITVLTIGSHAERQSQAVLLQDCILL